MGRPAPACVLTSQESGLATGPGVLPGEPGWHPGSRSNRTPGRVRPCAGFWGSQFQTGPCPGPWWLIKATPHCPAWLRAGPATGRRCLLTWGACIGTARPCPGNSPGHPTTAPSHATGPSDSGSLPNWGKEGRGHSAWTGSVTGSRTSSSRPGPQPWRGKWTLRLWPGAALSGPRTCWTVSCSGYRSKSSHGRDRPGLSACLWAWQGRAQEGWATGERQGAPPACSPTRLADDGAPPPLPSPGLGGQGGGPRAESRGRPGKVTQQGSISSATSPPRWAGWLVAHGPE